MLDLIRLKIYTCFIKKVAVYFDQNLVRINSKNSNLGFRQLQQIILSLQPRILDQRHVKVVQWPHKMEIRTDRIPLGKDAEQVNNWLFDVLRDAREACLRVKTFFLVGTRVIVSLLISSLFHPQSWAFLITQQLERALALLRHRSGRNLLMLHVGRIDTVVVNPPVLRHFSGVTAIGNLTCSFLHIFPIFSVESLIF